MSKIVSNVYAVQTYSIDKESEYYPTCEAGQTPTEFPVIPEDSEDEIKPDDSMGDDQDKAYSSNEDQN